MQCARRPFKRSVKYLKSLEGIQWKPPTPVIEAIENLGFKLGLLNLTFKVNNNLQLLNYRNVMILILHALSLELRRTNKKMNKQMYKLNKLTI